MIVEIKRKHRGAIYSRGTQIVGAYTEFSCENHKSCCQKFEEVVRARDLIYFDHYEGAYLLYDENLKRSSPRANFCPFCGEKIEYKLVSNIEVVQVKETKTRTVPNMVQQGFKEETYEETHSEEREMLK